MPFFSDNEMQRIVRDAFLKPYYEKHYPGQYRFIEPGDPLSVGGTDTIIPVARRIDEKIVRWPRNPDGTPRDNAYTAFALETMSCTVEGHKRDGWMKTNTVHWLFYCFLSQDEQRLDCYLIDMPALQAWFWAQDHDQWPCWLSNEINRTECRIVPFSDVLGSVRHKIVRLWREAEAAE